MAHWGRNTVVFNVFNLVILRTTCYRNKLMKFGVLSSEVILHASLPPIAKWNTVFFLWKNQCATENKRVLNTTLHWALTSPMRLLPEGGNLVFPRFKLINFSFYNNSMKKKNSHKNSPYNFLDNNSLKLIWEIKEAWKNLKFCRNK